MGISYADRGGTKGYQVRVMRNGKQYSKFFNARERGAKKKAEAYEKKLLKMLGPIRSDKGDKRPVRTNTGIRYISDAVGKYGTDCIRVTYRGEDGRWGSRDISVEKHGRDKAIRMAKKFHREFHTNLVSEKKVKSPSPKTVKRALDKKKKK